MDNHEHLKAQKDAIVSTDQASLEAVTRERDELKRQLADSEQQRLELARMKAYWDMAKAMEPNGLTGAVEEIAQLREQLEAAQRDFKLVRATLDMRVAEVEQAMEATGIRGIEYIQDAIDGVVEERDLLAADNAALLEGVKKAEDLLRASGMADGLQPWEAELEALILSPHPGATMIAETRKQRTQLAAAARALKVAHSLLYDHAAEECQSCGCQGDHHAGCQVSEIEEAMDGLRQTGRIEVILQVIDAAFRWRREELLTGGRWSPAEYALIDALEKYEDLES